MLFLQLLCLLTTLPQYDITVDPVLLQQIYENPMDKLEIPAVFYFAGQHDDCTIAFRGGTSLGYPKKSWHIRLNNETLVPWGTHILLNAQFRDPSLIRNTLGLSIIRELGFYSSLTEFVTLAINGTNMGVYERVQRIDRPFYEENNFAFGALFKSVDTLGRLLHHFSGNPPIYGFEPKVDSWPFTNKLERLVEDCFRGDVSSINTNQILAVFAANSASGNRDGYLKNFYLLHSSGIWYYLPWDMDASFGNAWDGAYDSLWVTGTFISGAGCFGAGRALLTDAANAAALNSFLQQTAVVFEDRLPSLVDSLHLLLRKDLSQDPFYQFSISQFDSICTGLSEDIRDRAAFLEDFSIKEDIAEISAFSINNSLNMGNTLEIRLSLHGGSPAGVLCPVAFDKNRETQHNMIREDSDSWVLSMEIPENSYSVHAAFAPYNTGTFLPVYYPPWALRTYDLGPIPTPSARVALADLSPEMLSPGTPLWCGENLWILPVTNNAPFPQDISLCRFTIGNPQGNVFVPESILVEAGETFYLSSDAEEAAVLFSLSNVYGNAGTSYPAGTKLSLLDPSWKVLLSWSVSAGDSLPGFTGTVVPCEISAGNGDDWLELYNLSENSFDLSGCYLMDSRKNVSYIPEYTVLGPEMLLLAAVNTEEGTGTGTIPLEFNLNSEEDSLFLYSRLGDQLFGMGWNTLWPMSDTGVIYLKLPGSPFSLPGSWEATAVPGTPGEANPGWLISGNYTRVYLVSENPSNGSFCFHYETNSPAAEALLYDISGRLAAEITLPPGQQGTVHADFSESLPGGIYILLVKSSCGTSSVKITVIR